MRGIEVINHIINNDMAQEELKIVGMDSTSQGDVVDTNTISAIVSIEKFEDDEGEEFNAIVIKDIILI